MKYLSADGRKRKYMNETYVIVKCEELGDQWECDADRTPLLVLINASPDRLKQFQHYGYEIYVASKDGKLTRIQEYYDYH